MPPRPIGELCTDPVETRARAARREPVPCYRCIAWTGELCELFHAARWRRGLTDITPGEQLTAFPTPPILNSHKKRGT